jgi:xanthine dehydrogenase YagS FAD-binding subunit
MQPFRYVRAEKLETAVSLATGNADSPVVAPAQFLAGGTTLIDLMKLGVMRPMTLVEINPLQQTAMGRIEVTSQGLRLGALVRMADAAEHEVIRRQYPVLAQSLSLAASQQLRNMATLGGNVLQRTRCAYFRDPGFGSCNKRDPGSGCAAIAGLNRQHAILGTSDRCIAAYPGDFAQALMALDANVTIMGRSGARTFRFADLHSAPGDSPHVETRLRPGELITAFTIPAGPHTQRSVYLKLRDRASFAFALVSTAVAVHLEGDRVRDVRIALGGVATKPWRALEAEKLLTGQVLDEQAVARAAEAAFKTARTTEHNAFKVPLGQQAIVRALMECKQLELSA